MGRGVRVHKWKRRRLIVLSSFVLALILIVTAVWMLYLYLPRPVPPDLAAGDSNLLVSAADAGLLLEAAALILTGVSVVVALLAFFGWQSIREKVEYEVELAYKKQKREDRGIVKLAQGAVYGNLTEIELFKEHLGSGADQAPAEQLHKSPSDLYLSLAIKYTRGARELLDGTEYDFIWKNNLAYYLALRERSLDAEEVLRLAEECRLSYFDVEDPELLLTYVRAIAVFARKGCGSPERSIVLLDRASALLEETLDQHGRTFSTVQRAAAEKSRELLATAKGEARAEVEARAGGEATHAGGRLERWGRWLDRWL